MARRSSFVPCIRRPLAGQLAQIVFRKGPAGGLQIAGTKPELRAIVLIRYWINRIGKNYEKDVASSQYYRINRHCDS